MTARTDLLAHLQTGATTVCMAWSVLRKDGTLYGFTDHDRDFTFDGVDFKASTGMTARALQQTTGLSVDNSEAVGALSDAAITEADIMAGRFDGAKVRMWLVNWSDVTERIQQFHGSFGEIARSAGSFRVELRGLTEGLNQVKGRVFHKACSAVLGDGQCKFNLAQSGFSTTQTVVSKDADGKLHLQSLPEFPSGWFDRGRLVVLTGAAEGLVGLVRFDRQTANERLLDLWIALGAEILPGDTVRLEAGCDKSADTCRTKFANFLNFRGFPHLPGEDWLTSYPVSSMNNDGGSLSS